MRLRSDPETEWTRVDESEVAALRERLGLGDSAETDLRSNGLITVSDVAEAFGIPTDAVDAQLRAIRADRAFSKLKRPKASQLGLAVLALIMFGTAWEIWRVKQPKTIDQVIAEETEALENAKLSRPKHIHYPVVSTMDLTGVLPAAFTPIEVDGRYTTTTAITHATKLTISRAEAPSLLSAALKKVFAQAAYNEAHVKKPDKPAKTNPNDPFGFNRPTAWSMACKVGNSMEQILLGKPPAGSPQSFQLGNPAAQLPSLDDQAQSVAEDAVKNAWATQQQLLNMDPASSTFPPGMILDPPPGFRYEPKSGTTGGPMMTPNSGRLLLPLDENLVARQMSRSLSSRLDSFTRPPEGGFAPATPKPVAKPAFDELLIDGPLSKKLFRFPIAPSPDYPNAAAVWRESHRLIAEAAEWAKDQVRQLNKGVRE